MLVTTVVVRTVPWELTTSHSQQQQRQQQQVMALISHKYLIIMTIKRDPSELSLRLDGRRAKLLPLLRGQVDLEGGGCFLQDSQRLGNSGQSVTGTAVFSLGPPGVRARPERK